MSIHFRPLFEVEVAHGYYPTPCSDIDYILPEAGRLLLRVRDGRLIVLHETDALGQPLVDRHGEELLIGLRSNNPYLPNFTEAPVAEGFVPLYENRSAPRALDAAQPANWLGVRLEVTASLAGRPLSFSWLRQGNVLVSQSLAVGDSVARFETRDWPAGTYTLRESDGGVPKDARWVLQPAWQSLPMWGALAITVDRNFYPNPPRFSIPLRARREQVKYYVVARNFGNTEFGNLNVNDAGAAEQGRPPVVFDKVNKADFADDDLPPEVLGDASARIVLFQSRTLLDRRAGGYRKLQLRRSTDVLVQHLPQAGSDRAQARFIVHLAKS